MSRPTPTAKSCEHEPSCCMIIPLLPITLLAWLGDLDLPQLRRVGYFAGFISALGVGLGEYVRHSQYHIHSHPHPERGPRSVDDDSIDKETGEVTHNQSKQSLFLFAATGFYLGGIMAILVYSVINCRKPREEGTEENASAQALLREPRSQV